MIRDLLFFWSQEHVLEPSRTTSVFTDPNCIRAAFKAGTRRINHVTERFPPVFLGAWCMFCSRAFNFVHLCFLTSFIFPLICTNIEPHFPSVCLFYCCWQLRYSFPFFSPFLFFFSSASLLMEQKQSVSPRLCQEAVRQSITIN